MFDSLPIVLIVIAAIMVAVALIALRAWTRQQQGIRARPIIGNKRAFFAQWIVGLCVALAGAFFMFDGEIFGENTSGIATIVGIVGISLIASSNVTLLGLGRKK